MFVPSALLLVLGGQKESGGERGALHVPAFEKGRDRPWGLVTSGPPLSHSGAAFIFTLAVFSSNGLCVGVQTMKYEVLL